MLFEACFDKRGSPFSRHSTLRKTIANHYALVYHWQGTNSSAKPVLLAAHQGSLGVTLMLFRC